jgi:transcription antitermination factor NusG
MMHAKIDSVFHGEQPPAGADARVFRWFCVAVRPGYTGLAPDGEEYEIARRLRLAGYEAFVPQFVSVLPARGPRRRAVERKSPLFRGYAFVRAVAPLAVEHRRAIADCEGVHTILGTHSGPSPMREGFVEALIEAGPVRAQPADLPTRFRKRMLARITAGAFAGLIGMVSRAESDKRIHILLRIFGTEREVTVPVSVLEAVDQPQTRKRRA